MSLARRCRDAAAPARRAVTLAAAAALALGTAALVAPAADAADTVTALPGVTRIADVAAGGGRIVVAAEDRVVFATPGGAVTGTIGRLPGAVGLAMTPDGARAYVALRDSNQVAELDPAQRRVVRRIDVPATPCPTNLALAGTRLWIGYGCQATGFDGGVAGIDVATPRPTPVPVVGGLYGVPLVAAARSVLVLAETGVSPGYAQVFAVGAGGTTTRRGTVGDQDCCSSYLRDLAVSPDGRLVVTAFGTPAEPTGWDTTTLARVRGYGVEGGDNPAAVAFSPDGARLAAGRTFGPTLSVHDTATATALYTDTAPGALVAGTLAFAGGDVVGALSDGQTWSLWIARGANLPGSTLTLTAPAAATARQPLAIAGRLTFASGAAPGNRRITVTRRAPDGTPATLPAVTTGTGGRFTVRDVPPVGGELTYTADWAGTGTVRGSTAAVTVPVAKIALTVTLTGPATAPAGRRLALSGTVLVGGAVPTAPVRLAVYRTVVNNVVGQQPEEYLTDVTTTTGGAFRVTDVPPQGGDVTYEVRREETAAEQAAQAAHPVAVSSRRALVYGSMQSPAYLREPYQVDGAILYETGVCAGPTTVQVTRQVGTGPVEVRPDVTTDAACQFTFSDSQPGPAEVRYGLGWDGDAGHDAVTGEITGEVTTVSVLLGVAAQDISISRASRS